MLAINGGEKAVTKEFPVDERYVGNELAYLKTALAQNTLFYAHGDHVKRFTKRFSEIMGMEYGVAASSCSAAIHTALAAIGVGPGDEVILPPITDMGGIIGILAQFAIPVFADLDPDTYNMTAESIEAAITSKTKAVVVTHLAGNPCEMDEIMAVTKKHGIYVVEDAAQAYRSFHRGKHVGTFGDIGCFSTNEFKHISTGDGGVCLTNNEDLAKKMQLFTDKGYNRFAKTMEEMRDVKEFCVNYRMTELQGAVGLAQLEKLNSICTATAALGNELTKQLRGIDGIIPPKVMDHNVSSYWFYMFKIDLSKFPCDVKRLGDAIQAEGVGAYGGYIGRCLYEYDFIKEGKMYPGSRPEDGFKNPRFHEYKRGLCPNAEQLLTESVNIKITSAYSMEDIYAIARAIKKVCDNRHEL